MSAPPSVRRRISFLNELNRIAGAQLASFDPVIYQETISGILRPCLHPNPMETSVSAGVPNSGCARGECSASGSIASSGLSILPADGNILSPSLPVPIRGSEENIGFTEEISVPNSNSGCARGGQSDGGYVFPSARHSDRPADGENTSPSLPIPSGMDTEDFFRSPFDFSHHSPNRHSDGEVFSPSVTIPSRRGSQEVSGRHSESLRTDLSSKGSQEVSAHNSESRHTDKSCRVGFQQNVGRQSEPICTDQTSHQFSDHHSEHECSDPSGRQRSQEFSGYYLKPRHTDQSGRGHSQEFSGLHSDPRRTDRSGSGGSQEFLDDHLEPQSSSYQSGTGSQEVSEEPWHIDRHTDQSGTGSQQLSGHHCEPHQTDQIGIASQENSVDNTKPHVTDQSGRGSQEVSAHQSKHEHPDRRGRGSQEVSVHQSKHLHSDQSGSRSGDNSSQSIFIPSGSGSQEIRENSNRNHLMRSSRKRTSQKKSSTDYGYDDDYSPSSSDNESSTSCYSPTSEGGNNQAVTTKHRATKTTDFPEKELNTYESISGFKTIGLHFTNQSRRSEDEFDSYSDIDSNASFLNSSQNNHSQQEVSNGKHATCIDLSSEETIIFGEGLIESSRNQSKPVIESEGKCICFVFLSKLHMIVTNYICCIYFINESVW